MELSVILDPLSWLCIGLGGFFIVSGAIGLVRMPDVYTRMHAASIIDSLGGALLLLGLALQAGLSLITLKLVFIFALFFFVSPVASHALAQAALHAGVEPKLDDDRREEREDALVNRPGDTPVTD